jgi:hypothetical protein
LVESCTLFPFFLNETEAKDTRARIAEVSHMDLISQAVAAKDIAEVQPSAALASANQ